MAKREPAIPDFSTIPGVQINVPEGADEFIEGHRPPLASVPPPARQDEEPETKPSRRRKDEGTEAAPRRHDDKPLTVAIPRAIHAELVMMAATRTVQGHRDVGVSSLVREFFLDGWARRKG